MLGRQDVDSEYWGWSRLLQRVLAIDWVTCPQCQPSALRLIAALTDPPVIRCLLSQALAPPTANRTRPLGPSRLRLGFALNRGALPHSLDPLDSGARAPACPPLCDTSRGDGEVRRNARRKDGSYSSMPVTHRPSVKPTLNSTWGEKCVNSSYTFLYVLTEHPLAETEGSDG